MNQVIKEQVIFVMKEHAKDEGVSPEKVDKLIALRGFERVYKMFMAKVAYEISTINLPRYRQ